MNCTSHHNKGTQECWVSWGLLVGCVYWVCCVSVLCWLGSLPFFHLLNIMMRSSPAFFEKKTKARKSIKSHKFITISLIYWSKLGTTNCTLIWDIKINLHHKAALKQYQHEDLQERWNSWPVGSRIRNHNILHRKLVETKVHTRQIKHPADQFPILVWWRLNKIEFELHSFYLY